MINQPDNGWPRIPNQPGWPPPPVPPRRNTKVKVAVAVIGVVLIGLLTALVLVLTNRGNDSDSGSGSAGGNAVAPVAPGSDRRRDVSGTARPTAPPAHPTRAAEDYEQPALGFVGAAQNGDEHAAGAVSCAAFRGKFPIKPLVLRGPDGTTITEITRYEMAGSDVAGDRSDAKVGVRVFGSRPDGAEGQLLWVFDVKSENGHYVVCGTRIKAGDDMNFN